MPHSPTPTPTAAPHSTRRGAVPHRCQRARACRALRRPRHTAAAPIFLIFANLTLSCGLFLKNLRTSVLLSVPSPLLSARANTLCAKATAASFDSVAASRTAVWSAAVAFVGVICALGEGEDLGEEDAGAAPLAALPRFLGTRRGMRGSFVGLNYFQ